MAMQHERQPIHYACESDSPEAQNFLVELILKKANLQLAVEFHDSVYWNVMLLKPLHTALYFWYTWIVEEEIGVSGEGGGREE